MIRYRTKGYIWMLLVLLFVSSDCAGDSISSSQPLLELSELYIDYLYYGVEGYYPNYSYRDWHYELVNSGENTFAVQPLLFLKVIDTRSNDILYTRNFDLKINREGFLAIQEYYVLQPPIEMSEDWETVSFGDYIGILNNNDIHELFFYTPMCHQYEVYDGVFYIFDEVTRVKYYFHILGSKDIPTTSRISRLVADYMRISWELRSTMPKEEANAILKEFANDLYKENRDSFVLFSQYIDFEYP